MKLLAAFVVLAACGDPQKAPDAGAMPDAGPAPITVYVSFDAGSNYHYAQAGAAVLFFDPTGNLVDRQVTGSDGLARGNAPEHSSVTVVTPARGNLYSWVDVAPGDHLYTTPIYVAPPTVTIGTANVILPSDGDDVSSYGVSGPRYQASGTGSGAGAVTIMASVYSDAPKTGDLVAEATHTDGRHRYLVARDVAIDSALVDLSSGTWADATPLPFAFTEIAADTTSISASYELLSGNHSVWGAGSSGLLAANGQFPIEAPAPIDSHSVMTFIFHRGPDGHGNGFAVSFRQPTPMLDVQALEPPDATAATLSGYTATWDIAGDPTHATGVWVMEDLGNGASWTAILPPDRRTFEPPALPPDLDWPAGPTHVHVTFFGGNDPAGYAGLRTDPLVMSPFGYAFSEPATPGVYRSGMEPDGIPIVYY